MRVYKKSSRDERVGRSASSEERVEKEKVEKECE